MSLSILVLGSPFSTQASYSAYRFTKAALESSQEIHRVFFYQDGIHTGSDLATPPQDEFNLYKAWQELKKEYDLDLVVCIAAAARRGLINTTESKRHNKEHFNLSDAFELSGLGQLVEACALSEKLVTFGN